MYAIDAKTKEVLYSRHASHLFIPASIAKLFTSAAALDSLGPSYVFETIVKSSTLPDKEGKMNGQLYLVGGADPFLNTQALKQLARDVYERGVRVVKGKLIVDDSLFKGSPLPIHGEWQDLTMDYACEQSALSINDNIVKVTILPHAATGKLAEIQVEQEIPYCQLINQVLTSRKAKMASLSISRGLTDNLIAIEGVIPLSHPAITTRIAIHNPQEYAKEIFRKALQEEGILVMETMDQPDESRFYEMARISSVPLSLIIYKMNKQSHNLSADLLFKYMAQKFSLPYLVNNALDQLMNKIGINSSEYKLYDGSGLSRHNLITPKQTVKLLEYANEASFKDEFMASLPIGGRDGTLVHRFQDLLPYCQIRAKTGHMSGINNLAGYMEFPNGRQIIFAIFIDHSLLSADELTMALDACVSELVFSLK
jgi:D-alanyl-D-alanine carboxypeptidase/D-alanyl-D-alanine-endopeptidase (penicillin-binding protein 4)